jgi:hypothetical protein
MVLKSMPDRQDMVAVNGLIEVLYIPFSKSIVGAKKHMDMRDRRV